MERRPRCGAAVCDYALPPEENQSTDYTLQLAVGLASQSQWSELTDTQMAMQRIYSFCLFYVKQPSQTDNQGFHVTVGIPWNVDTVVRRAPIALFIHFFQIQCHPCKTSRDTKILFTLISASALVETLITVLHSVGLLLQPQAGQRWPTFKQ